MVYTADCRTEFGKLLDDMLVTSVDPLCVHDICGPGSFQSCTDKCRAGSEVSCFNGCTLEGRLAVDPGDTLVNIDKEMS